MNNIKIGDIVEIDAHSEDELEGHRGEVVDIDDDRYITRYVIKMFKGKFKNLRLEFKDFNIQKVSKLKHKTEEVWKTGSC